MIRSHKPRYFWIPCFQGLFEVETRGKKSVESVECQVALVGAIGQVSPTIRLYPMFMGTNKDEPSGDEPQENVELLMAIPIKPGIYFYHPLDSMGFRQFWYLKGASL